MKRQARLETFFKKKASPRVEPEPGCSTATATTPESAQAPDDPDPQSHPAEETSTASATDSQPTGPARHFKPSWKTEFRWLHYQPERRVAVCDPCSEAVKAGHHLGSRADAAFVTTGFSNWKNAVSRFRNHEASEAHKSAVLSLASRRRPNPTLEMAQSSKVAEKIENTKALHGIFDAIATIAAQGQPFRRREEGAGVFRRTVELVSRHNVALANWLKRSERGKHAFLSHHMQREMLRMISLSIQRSLAREIKEAGPFALIVDETTDATGKEQVSLCFRVVSKDMEPLELFAGMYAVPATDAQTLTTIILDALSRWGLDPKDIRGQAYDGASNMSGRYSGVQARIKEIAPAAVFVHCTAHRLNLMVQDTFMEIRSLSFTMSQVNALVTFYRDSPKRLVALEDAGAESSLRPLCPTRWTCREGCLASIVKNYEALQDCLESLAAPGPGARKGACATASGLALQMGSFDFFFCLHLGLHLMRMMTPVMKAVQGQKQTVTENLRMIAALGTMVSAQRARFDEFWSRVEKARTNLRVGEPKLRRASTVPRRLDSGSAPYQPETPRDAYRKVFYEAVDMLSQQLRGRGGGDDHVLASIETALTTADETAVRLCAELYGLDRERLQLHVSMLGDVAGANGMPLRTLGNVVALMQSKALCIAPLVPEAGALLRLALVVPATTCTAERSFSLLRRLKSWLRTTMTQERLNHSAICAMYDDAVLALDVGELVVEFVGRTAERKALFHVPAASASTAAAAPRLPESESDDGDDM